MHIDLQKLLNYLLLALSIGAGVVTGVLSGRIIDLSLGGEVPLMVESVSRPASIRQLDDADFQVILDRNLFNSLMVGQTSDQINLSSAPVTGKTSTVARSSVDLALIGTIVAGDQSLALIKIGNKAGVFRLKAELSPGVAVIEIARHMVVLRDHGVRRELKLKKRKETVARQVRQGGKAAAGRGVVAQGEDRWKISRTAAENARANLNSLLQTARMIPQVQNGKTIGFKLVELERGSLLEQIGLKVGDLVVEINQVELNSPEKALQVFQQVREAKNISLGLVRGGQRKTFEYNLE